MKMKVKILCFLNAVRRLVKNVFGKKTPAHDPTPVPVVPVPEVTAEQIGAFAEKMKQAELGATAQFGVKGKRTREQWANLVLEFGYAKICEFEGLTPAQLRKKIMPSFSEQMAENTRRKNIASLKNKHND